MGTYRHTQIGWVILFGVGAAAVATLVRAGARPSTGHIVVLLALVLVLALFSTLTVVGDEDGLDVRFGPGAGAEAIQVERHPFGHAGQK